MPIKIFCNACQQYIRDAKRSEIGMLPGKEVCEDCELKMQMTWRQIDKIQHRAEQRINKAVSKIRAELDEAINRVVKPEAEKSEAEQS